MYTRRKRDARVHALAYTHCGHAPHGKRTTSHTDGRRRRIARFPPGAFPATTITLLAALNRHTRGTRRGTVGPASCPDNTSTTTTLRSLSASGVAFEQTPRTRGTRGISRICWYFERRGNTACRSTPRGTRAEVTSRVLLLEQRSRDTEKGKKGEKGERRVRRKKGREPNEENAGVTRAEERRRRTFSSAERDHWHARTHARTQARERLSCQLHKTGLSPANLTTG